MNIIVTLKPDYYFTASNIYGIIAEIDWENKKVVRQLKIPTASFQDDQAFMTCFLNGLCSIGNRIFAAAWNFIIEVDYDSFQVVNAYSLPYMTDLHGLETDGKNIWVASTGIDSLLCLDAETLALKWRWGPDEPILDWEDTDHPSQKKGVFAYLSRFFKAKPHSPKLQFIDKEYRYVHKTKSPYHRHHLNDMTFHQDHLYVTTKDWNKSGKRSAVIRFNPQTWESEFFVQPGGFSGMHDGIFLDGKFFVTESGSNSVAWREENSRITSKAIEPQPYFVRGLCWTGSSFLVGFSTWRDTQHPAQIVEFDPTFEKTLSAMDISGFYTQEQQTTIHTIMQSPGGQ